MIFGNINFRVVFSALLGFADKKPLCQGNDRRLFLLKVGKTSFKLLCHSSDSKNSNDKWWSINNHILCDQAPLSAVCYECSFVHIIGGRWGLYRKALKSEPHKNTLDKSCFH